MTARPVSTRSLPLPRPGWGATFARLLDRIEAARERARQRAELRQRLRADARLRRDIGLSRLAAMELDHHDYAH